MTPPPPPSKRVPLCALTIWNPWAYWVSIGWKTIENRTWAPPASAIGRHLAIHAGKRLHKAMAADALEFVKDLRAAQQLPSGPFDGLPVTMRTVPYGAIVAVCRLVGWTRASDDPWFVGPVGWQLADVIPIDPPVSCNGDKGLWLVEGETLALVRERFDAGRRRARAQATEAAS